MSSYLDERSGGASAEGKADSVWSVIRAFVAVIGVSVMGLIPVGGAAVE